MTKIIPEPLRSYPPKTKWIIMLLVAMDLLLIIMHLTNYFFLFLKPTGYMIPIMINIIVITIIGFRSPLIHNVWPAVVLLVSIPILLIHSFMILIAENNYTKIESPQSHQSLVIEYRHFTLGETTYTYNFYKTRFGLVGKFLDDQSMRIMIPSSEHPSVIDADGVLGLEGADWVTDNIVRFSTWKGMKEVHLKPNQPIVSTPDSESEKDSQSVTSDIEAFIEMVEKKQGGQILLVNRNRNRLEIRYDEAVNQSWIDVNNDNVEEEGNILRQQCSRITRNEERGYYMLEECTLQWEYALYPMEESR
ncbi:hypothetical protein [Robertmurraya sp. Marseille-Q9965]